MTKHELEQLEALEREREEAMLEYYGLIEEEGSLEAQMRENGVSWSDFI